MKKLLALVLALVMTLGLATVSANAATTYSDESSITNKQAVQVLSAIGVFDGQEGNAFNPTGTLTREQGAKILTYMLLGKTAADALTVSVAPFDDVAADRWSAGSIAYCKNVGILGGVGDNKFQPEAPLTGAAFAKMCLTALGYDAKREGLGGDDWQLNVMRLVNGQANLANEVTGFALNTPLTRQNAAQIAFNTLTATMQEYVAGLTVDRNGNLAVGRSDVLNGNAGNGYTYLSNGTAKGADDGFMQFVENYYPTLKCYTKQNDYGQTVQEWFLSQNREDYWYTEAKAVTEVATSKANNVWTTEIGDVTNGQLYTLFGGDDAENAAAVTTKANRTGSDMWIPVVENGVDNSYLVVTKNANNAKDLGKLYKGAKVEAVDTNTPKDGIPNRLEVTYGYLAKVTKVNAATSSKARNIQMEIYVDNNGATAGATNKVTNVTYETEDFAKDDYVLVYPKAKLSISSAFTTANQFTTAGINEVKLADSVNGSLTAINGTNTATADSNISGLTIDGTKYSVAANSVDRAAVSGTVATATHTGGLNTMGLTAGTTTVGQGVYSLNDGYTLYLSNGFVVGVKGDDVAWKDYVYVVDVGIPSNTALLGPTKEVTYVAQDGTFKTVKMVIANATGSYINPGKNQWVTVAEDEDASGYYVFKAPKATSSALLTTDAGLPVLNSKTPTFTQTSVPANDKTVFIVRDGSSSFKVFTGISNVGNWKYTTGTTGMDPNTYFIQDGTYANLAYADFYTGATTKGLNDNSVDTPILLLEIDSQTTIDGKTRFLYNAIQDGALTQVVGTNENLMTSAYDDAATTTVDESKTGALVTYNTNSSSQLNSTDKTAADLKGTNANEKFAAWSTLNGTGNSITIKYSAPTITIQQTSATVADVSFTVKADAPVYYFNKTDKTLDVVTASDITGQLTFTADGSKDGSIWLQFESATNHTVKAIWVATTGID